MVGEIGAEDDGSALAARIRNGDRAAEAELVERFAKRICTMLRARLRDAEAARDLAQEAILAVLEALRGGRLRDGERLVAFVHGTVRNIANNHLRKLSEHPLEPLDEAILKDPGRESAQAMTADDGERVRRARSAMAVLGEVDRLILLLTLVEGLKTREVAARLGLRTSWVQLHKWRAIRRVSKSLEGGGSGRGSAVRQGAGE